MEVRKTAVLLALLTLLAPIVGAVAISPAGAAQSVPDGMVGISDGQIDSELPPNTPMGEVASDLQAEGVHTTKHADTLNITVTNPGRAKKYTDGSVFGGGPVAIVMTDNQYSEGRTVALPKPVLKDTLGYVPEAAYGTHEDGSRWMEETTVEDGYVLIDVPHFSSNTVTFSGTYTYSGSPASDGSSNEYDIGDLDAVSNFSIEASGVLNTEWDNESASDVGLSSSQSLSVGGNLQPTDGAGGDPQLTVTANGQSASYNPFYDEGDGVPYDAYDWAVGDTSTNSKHAFEARIQPSYSGEIKQIDVNVGPGNDGADYGTNVGIYLVQESRPDGTYGEGTKISTWDPDWSTGEQTINVDNPPTVSAGTYYSLEFVTESTDSDGTADQLSFKLDDSASTEWVSNRQGTVSDYYLNASISVDESVDGLSVGDGTGESVSFGNMNNGQTTTKAINLDSSSTALDWSGSGGGSVDWSLQMQERTETVDPKVEVNGQWTNYTGALSDGTTTSLTTDTAWLQEGTNRVNISVGDGTLSGDAPSPQVDLAYSHDLTDDQTITYNSERWTSRYNVSKTFSSSRSESDLAIPFDNTVFAINDLEYRVNQSGSWSAVADADYTLEGNDLDVDLDAVYGSSIPAGTTVEIRADARKVDPVDVSISVLNGTDRGSKLDSKIQIESTGSNPRLEVAGIGNGTYVHYLYSETWQASEYSVFDGNGGQALHMPSASAGETAYVTHLPTEVKSGNGDVKVAVTETGSSPTMDVSPGPNGENADSVEFVHHSTVSGQTYVLNSMTNGIVRDSGTASSPVTLVDDDSDETLEIFAESSGSSSGGDSGSGGIQVVGQFTNDSGGLNWGLIVLALAAALALLAIVQVRTGRSPISSAAGGVTDAGSMLAARPKALAAVLAIAFAGSIALGIIAVPESVFIILIVGGVALGSYVGLQQTGNFTFIRWLAILALTAIATLAATGQLAAIFGMLGTSGSAIAILGLLFVGYKALNSAGEPNTVNRLIFRGDN